MYKKTKGYSKGGSSKRTKGYSKGGGVVPGNANRRRASHNK
tara:strand:+ start:334 stop:456 length:123 start_codon:yes stop_codon:yes gene_type:complete